LFFSYTFLEEDFIIWKDLERVYDLDRNQGAKQSQSISEYAKMEYFSKQSTTK